MVIIWMVLLVNFVQLNKIVLLVLKMKINVYKKEKNVEYRTLGKTGLAISRLGFGGIPIQKIDAEGTKTLVEMLKKTAKIFGK